MNGKIRISILDGFRAIAILSVLLYHYFSRWTPPIYKTSLYPYDDKYNFFSYGYLGVQFFFIISGFVIFFTLERTDGIISFWKKRMIRLLPAIIFSSLIIVFIFKTFDPSRMFNSSHALKNLIPSISFINPNFFDYIFNVKLSYVNGSYWSLWPEIQFYVLASVIYYINKRTFLKNFMITSIVLIGLNYILMHVQGNNKLNLGLPTELMGFYSKWIYNGFNLSNYLPFFCLGVLFYKLSMNKRENYTNSLPLKLCLLFMMAFMLYSGVILPIRIIFLVMISAFLIFIYYPEKLSFLERPVLLKIGIASYFLYLIHENLGVLIINTIGPYFLPNTPVLPILLIIGFSYLSILFTTKIDQPIGNWLKSKLDINKKAATK